MSTLRLHANTAAAPTDSRGSGLAVAALVGLRRQIRRLRWPAARAVQSPAEQANQVRRMALELRRTDPRVADELFAAADRHERLHS